MKMTLIRLKMEKKEKEKEKEGKLNLFQTPTWPPRYLNSLIYLSLPLPLSISFIYILTKNLTNNTIQTHRVTPLPYQEVHTSLSQPLLHRHQTLFSLLITTN